MSEDKSGKKLSKLALAKLRKLNKTDIAQILDKISQNKNEINKLKSKKGLCPQSIII